MLKYLCLVLPLCGLAAAGEPPALLGESELVGRRFALTELNGVKLDADWEMHIEFPGRGQIAGRVCNVFRGPCAVDGFILTADIAASRLRCPDDKLREAEDALLRCLRLGVGFILAGDRLELRRDDISIVFRRAGNAGKPAPDAGGVTGKDLAGRKFVLASVDGTTFAVERGEQPYLEFSADLRLSGSACNSFSGQGELENGKLFLRSAATTGRMCLDGRLSAYERDFHHLLRAGAEVSLREGELTLSGNGKRFVYR